MKVSEILEKYQNKESNIIPILTEIQSNSEFNFISKEAIFEVAKALNISESKIYSVITFYSHLSSEKQGRNIIQVCSSVSCYLHESVNIIDVLQKELKINVNETTTDEVFTLETCSCLGCCDQAPVMRVNQTVYGNLTPEKIRKILNDIRGEKND